MSNKKKRKQEQTPGDADQASSSAKDEQSSDAEAEAEVPRWKKIVREIVLLGVLVLVIFSARWSLADHYHVPSGSMIPTVEVGDRIVVNKLAYSLRIPFTTVSLVDFDPPHHGDIVVLDSPVEDVVLLKRVIATPGDVVEVKAGRVWLNDEEVAIEEAAGGLSEKLGDVTHPIRLSNGGGPDFGPLTLGEQEYLVMGDNRGNSRDGRSFGLITMDAILGQAVRVYYRSSDGLTWREL